MLCKHEVTGSSPVRSIRRSVDGEGVSAHPANPHRPERQGLALQKRCTFRDLSGIVGALVRDKGTVT